MKKQSLDKREQLRNQMMEKEMQEVKAKPEINPASKTLSRPLDAIIAWGKERDDRINALRKKKEQNESHVVQAPVINVISEKIASQMDRGQQIHDHLLEQHKKRKQEQTQKVKKIIEKEMNESVPMISIHSANLQRDEEVFDRLYNVSLEKESKKRQVLEHHESLLKQHLDPNTGHKLYSPFINPRSSAIVRSEAVQDILYKKSEEKRQKIEHAVMREQQAIDDTQKISKVGAYSQLLVELLEMRTNTTTQERLTKPKEDLDTSLIDPTSTYSFKPKINQYSRDIDRQVNGVVSRPDLLMKKGTEYKKKQKRLKEELIQSSLAECTFSPRSNSPRRSLGGNINNTSIAERSSEWVKRIDRKIEQERIVAASKQIEGCTFRPKLNFKSTSPPRSKTPPPQRKVESTTNTSRSMTPPPQRGNKIQQNNQQIKIQHPETKKIDPQILQPSKLNKSNVTKNESIKSKTESGRTPRKLSPKKKVKIVSPQSSPKPSAGNINGEIQKESNWQHSLRGTHFQSPRKQSMSPRMNTQSPRRDKENIAVSQTNNIQKSMHAKHMFEQPNEPKSINSTVRRSQIQSKPIIKPQKRLTHKPVETTKPLQRRNKKQQQQRTIPMNSEELQLGSGTFSDLSMGDLLDSGSTMSQLHALRYERESGEMEAVLREREEERMIHRYADDSSLYSHVDRVALQEHLMRDMNLGELKLSPEIMHLLHQLGLSK
jgi:hypothetical protein